MEASRSVGMSFRVERCSSRAPSVMGYTATCFLFSSPLVFTLFNVREISSCNFFFQAEDGIRDYKVTGVQTCALPIQAEDGIDYKVTGVQTCALPIQAEDGIDYKVTGVQTCALPI